MMGCRRRSIDFFIGDTLCTRSANGCCKHLHLQTFAAFTVLQYIFMETGKTLESPREPRRTQFIKLKLI